MPEKLYMTIDGQKVPVNWSRNTLPTPEEGQIIAAEWRKRNQKPASRSNAYSAPVGPGLTKPAPVDPRMVAGRQASIQRMMREDVGDSGTLAQGQLIKQAKERQAEKQGNRNIKNILADDERQASNIGGAIRPVTDFIANNLNVTKHLLTPQQQEAQKEMFNQAIAGALNAPNSMINEMRVIGSKDATPIQRLGAGANIALNLIPAEELAAGVIIKGGKRVLQAGKEAKFARQLQVGLSKQGVKIDFGEAKAMIRSASEKVEAKVFKPVVQPKPKAPETVVSKQGGFTTARRSPKPAVPVKQEVKAPVVEPATKNAAPVRTLPEVQKNPWEVLSDAQQNLNKIRKENADAGVTASPVGKPAPPPQATVRPIPKIDSEPVGISHAEVSKVRSELGWEPTSKTPKPDKELFNEAKTHRGYESAIADRVLADPKKKVSDAESLALGARLLDLKSEMQAAKKSNKLDAYDMADAEAARIADALDSAGTEQGRGLRARRFIAKDFDAWEFQRGTTKANLDEPLHGKKAKAQAGLQKQLEETNKRLISERDAAVKDYENLLANVKKVRGERRITGPNTQRRRALTSLRKLGIPTAEYLNEPALVANARMRSKQSGAIRLGPVETPEGSTEQVAMAVRSLARSYFEEGANDWKGVLSRLQRDIPGIEEEQALFILSGKYKKAKIEADVAKSRAMGFMRTVQRDAEFRMKPVTAKIVHGMLEFGNTTQRTLQTSLDNSLSLIQMKNVLAWKPGTWMKGVGRSFQAMVKKDPLTFARKHLADIENHPLYAKAKQAKLALSDVDGAYAGQEEAMAGLIENYIPGLSHSKAMATVLGNEIRFDLFRKLASAAPKDATGDYYADIARQINIITGKGTGRLAEKLGGREAGMVAYAPRYYLSKWQHAAGTPIWRAKSAAGRGQAVKMYATQLAFYGAAIKAAQLFGFDIELDPRSTNFGVATAKDGSYSFDLFSKQSEAVKVMAQLIYGRISKKGNYSDPGDYNAYSPGDYIEGKASPIMRSAMMFATGQTYDDDTGKRRTAQGSDFWRSFIPLSIKEMQKMKEKPATFPASFMGAGIDKGQKKAINVPKLGALPPGLARILGQAK